MEFISDGWENLTRARDGARRFQMLRMVSVENDDELADDNDSEEPCNDVAGDCCPGRVFAGGTGR